MLGGGGSRGHGGVVVVGWGAGGWGDALSDGRDGDATREVGMRGWSLGLELSLVGRFLNLHSGFGFYSRFPLWYTGFTS